MPHLELVFENLDLFTKIFCKMSADLLRAVATTTSNFSSCSSLIKRLVGNGKTILVVPNIFFMFRSKIIWCNQAHKKCPLRRRTLLEGLCLKQKWKINSYIFYHNVHMAQFMGLCRICHSFKQNYNITIRVCLKLFFSLFILLLIFVGYKVISFVKNKFNTVLKMNHILMILVCIWKTQNLFPILMPEFNYESWINSKLHISDGLMAIHYMYIAEIW